MSKVKIQIKSWLNGSVLFEYEPENATMRKAVEAAIADGANLRDADLRDANLRDATVYYTDQEIEDAFYNRIVDKLVYGTAIESVETEMEHDLPSCNRWDFTWKNVLKIKSWKLKADEAGSPAPSDTAEKSNVPSPDTTPADDKSNQEYDGKSDIEIGDSIVFQYRGYGVEALRGKVIAIEGEKLVVKFVAAADHYYIVDQSEFTVIKIDE